MPGGGALFGNSSTRSQSKNLVEFRAGKMLLKGKMVHPDKRKGQVYVHQSDDSLMHFCWKDRQSGAVEDDLIIFPDDCEYKRIAQCTTGRVYVLKFKSSNRKFFFWMQEPKTEKDEELCRRVNEVLNNPPTPGSGRSSGAPQDGDLQNLLNNMSQQQLMQLFGGVGPMSGLSSLLGSMRSVNRNSGSRTSTNQSSRPTPTSSTTSITPSTTSSSSTSSTVSGSTAATAGGGGGKTETTTTPSATAASAGSKPAINLQDLRQYLSGLNVPTLDGQQRQAVDLSSALTAEALQPLLTDPNFVEQLQQHLPQMSSLRATLPPTIGPDDSEDSSEQLRSTFQSPQFQQALSMFSAGLQSGQLGPIVEQFGVGPDAVTAANEGNMEAFIRALQAAQKGSEKDKDDKKEKKPPQEEKKDDDDDDDRMCLG